MSDEFPVFWLLFTMNFHSRILIFSNKNLSPETEFHKSENALIIYCGHWIWWVLFSLFHKKYVLASDPIATEVHKVKPRVISFTGITLKEQKKKREKNTFKNNTNGAINFSLAHCGVFNISNSL